MIVKRFCLLIRVLTIGVDSFSVTLKTAGSQTVTATDTVTTSITVLASITVSASGVCELCGFWLPGSCCCRVAHSVTVTAKDHLGIRLRVMWVWLSLLRVMVRLFCLLIRVPTTMWCWFF